MEIDYSFDAMGSDVRLLIGPPLAPSAPPPEQAAEREHAFVLDFDARLSRFRAESELSQLNHDRREHVPASPLLRAAVSAGLWAAHSTGGLVEPTLVREIEQAGYRTSRARATPASLVEALALAPRRRPAQPNPASRWGEVSVSAERGTVSRPAGVMLDTGGTGKGLCADAVAYRLRHYTRFVVDCGGDIAVGGVGAQLDPYEIDIEHPLTHARIGSLRIAKGGVATSGLNARIWRTSDGSFAHHLLDPSTGRPAWTGLVSVTALAPSALEAETLSKLALLSGPDGAARVLREHGGVFVRDAGVVEVVGPLDLRAPVAVAEGAA